MKIPCQAIHLEPPCSWAELKEAVIEVAAAGAGDDAADHLDVLVVVERWRLPGGPDGHESFGAAGDLRIHETIEVVVGDLAVAEGRHKCGDGAGELARIAHC